MDYFVTGGSGFIGRNLVRGLIGQGHSVKALVRSAASAEVVQALGARPILGDMLEKSPLISGMQGADGVFHLAADTRHGGRSIDQEETNVNGTKTVMEAALEAGVPRALHLSSEAVLLSGAPLINANETTPMPTRFAGGYSRSKALAERAALAANQNGLAVVVLRPRFVWGRDDSTALPALIEAAQSGKLAWIGGGGYLTSTTHVDNVVHAMILTLKNGQGGEVYFATDGLPISFREFVSNLLETQKEPVPTKSVPRWLVVGAVRAGEVLAKLTGGRISGPMSAQEYATLGVEVTLDISKAKADLGYEPVISIAQGMAALSCEKGSKGG